MANVPVRILVLSDVHYASEAEKARSGYEAAAVERVWRRLLLRAYRRYVWLKDPFGHNHLLDRFVERSGQADLVVANGDYSCDSAFVGVSDDSAAESVRMVLARLCEAYGNRFCAVMGDHELGKVSLAGGQGGLRWASWERATHELGLEALWRRNVGSYVAMGFCSTLLALPVYEAELKPSERSRWRALRKTYLCEIQDHLAGMDAKRPLLFFVHDPSALPFLGDLPVVRERLGQVAATIIGHLHSPLVYWKSQLLAGLPPINFMGHAVRRMSQALHRAKAWRPFRVHLCPSLAGIELLKDGGYLELLGRDSGVVDVRHHRLPR